MTTVRVMFVGQGESELPEDRFINTFHFHNAAGPSYSGVVGDLHTAVQDFYNTHTSGGNTVANLISLYCKRDASTVAYDLDEATPRVPNTDTFTLDPAVGTGLPEEVAICLSYHGDPPVTPRRRGRIYIGPLANNASVIEGGNASLHASVANGSVDQAQFVIVAAAEGLMAAASLLDMPWSIRSTRPTVNYVPISGGYVDTNFDIIRRRGPQTPVSRLVFP